MLIVDGRGKISMKQCKNKLYDINNINLSKNSQENKKSVSFDIPISTQEINEETENCGDLQLATGENLPTNDNEGNGTAESHVDVNLCNESYDKMKDMILKKHNLDSSPQFVYAKNSTYQTGNAIDDKIVTSKFFQDSNFNTIIQKGNMTEVNEKSEKCGSISSTNEKAFDEYTNMKEDEVVVPSPKANKKVRLDQLVTGLLFKHGSEVIPDSLNVSISTTGFEEGDTDFPHCLDSSLLLSPKADYPMTTSEQNNEVTSQEVPNFLSGLRRTAFSFFGQSAGPSESKANTIEQSQNNFNFNFGDEKKGRGGLFNMFN